jgi:hypothetical protein
MYRGILESIPEEDEEGFTVSVVTDEGKKRTISLQEYRRRA